MGHSSYRLNVYKEDALIFFLTPESLGDSYQNLVKNWIKNNLKKYERLELQNDENLREKVFDFFRKVDFEKIVGIDLNALVKSQESKIVPLFFEIKTVADNTYVKNIKNILLNHIEPKLDRVLKLQENNTFKRTTYLEGISRYLKAAFEKYSYVRTIIFGNNRQRLEDLYVPLTLISKKTNVQYSIPNDTRKILEITQKILISSTAGMGKSTLVKRIFLDIVSSNQGVPIFIELRRLNDKNSVFGEVINRLKPLYGKIAPEGLFAMIEQGDFIFILDGFDEIEDRFKAKVIQKLNDFISKSIGNNFILTSRPETALSSFADFQEYSIKDLEAEEAFEVLRKYGRNLEYSEELISKIRGEAFESIKEFLRNPLLVSLLYKAYEYKRRIPYKKHLFYSQVYDALYENHDLTKEGFTRQKKSDLDINNFEAVLRYIAYKTAIIRKTEYTKSELEELLKKAKSFYGLSFSVADFIKDLLSSVPLFTVEGNYYNWSHKSLQDYFAARFIQMDTAEKQSMILRKIYESINCDRFDNLLDILFEIDYKAFRNTIIYWISKEYYDFQENSYQGFNNIDTKMINLRQSIMFKRRLFLLKSRNELKNIEDLTLSLNNRTINRELDVTISLMNYQCFLKSFSHFQYYFLEFLAKKNHKLVISKNTDRISSFQVQVDGKDNIDFELLDSSKLWPNKDKYHFEKMTKLLESNFPFRINYSICISEKVRIENDIKMKEEDDLLQFE